MKPTLIYIGDPLCSWCYGFAPEISQLKKHLGDRYDFELIMGGLRPYNTQTMTELGSFLQEHWQHVEERSGQPFDYTILKDSSFVYDTEPPARAVVVVRHLKPDAEYAFYKAVQSAFYAKNKNTHDIQTYLDIAEDLAIDKTAFQKSFESDEMKALIRRDFERTAEMGVAGFPTVLIRDGETLFMVAKGYADFVLLKKQVELVEGRQ